MTSSRIRSAFLALFVFAAGFALGSVPTEVRAAGVMVDIPSGNETIKAYVSAPGKKGGPAVVIVQEWWGLDGWIKSVADKFAAQGYTAIAPDLYRGQVATEPELAHELLRGLPDERAIRDIRAAATWARLKTGGAASRVGVIGFCMGGRLALLSSLDKGPFDATVIAYGSPETNPERLKTLKGRLLGIFGGADRGIGKDQTEALKTGLEKAKRKGQVIVYPGAGHGFMNDMRPGQYDAASSLVAWAEIREFFQSNLK